MTNKFIKKIKEGFNNPELRESLAKANKVYINGIDVSPNSKEIEKITKIYTNEGYKFNDGNFPARKELSKKEQRKLEKQN